MFLAEARAQLQGTIDSSLWDQDSERQLRLGKFLFPYSLLREWYARIGFLQYSQGLPWKDDAVMWVFSIPEGETGRSINPFGDRFLKQRPGYRKILIGFDPNSSRPFGVSRLNLVEGKNGELELLRPISGSESGSWFRRTRVYDVYHRWVLESDLNYHTRFLQAATRVSPM